MTQPPPTDAPRPLIAWIGEDGELDHVLRAALDRARADGARVILYDHDTASAFSDPVPNEWASQDEGDLFNDPLDDAQLVKLGLEPLARKVAAARRDGLDAWGWPATAHGTGEAVDYARRHGAGLLLLPDDLDDPGLRQRLRGETVDKAVQEAEAAPQPLQVALVATDGTVTPVTGATTGA